MSHLTLPLITRRRSYVLNHRVCYRPLLSPHHISFCLFLSLEWCLSALCSLFSLSTREIERSQNSVLTTMYLSLSLSLYVEIERVARAADVDVLSVPLCLLSRPPPRRRRYVRNHSVCYRPLQAPLAIPLCVSLSRERDASLLSALYSLSLERDSLTS